MIVVALEENEITCSEAMVECSFDELVLPDSFKAGKKALIRGAIKKAGVLVATAKNATTEDGEVHTGLRTMFSHVSGLYIDCAAGLVDQLGSALERALTRKDREKDVAHVDVARELANRGLDAFFLVDTWPPSLAVCVVTICLRVSILMVRCGSWRLKSDRPSKQAK